MSEGHISNTNENEFNPVEHDFPGVQVWADSFIQAIKDIDDQNEVSSSAGEGKIARYKEALSKAVDDGKLVVGDLDQVIETFENLKSTEGILGLMMERERQELDLSQESPWSQIAETAEYHVVFTTTEFLKDMRAKLKKQELIG
jgi:hypothetical protein